MASLIHLVPPREASLKPEWQDSNFVVDLDYFYLQNDIMLFISQLYSYFIFRCVYFNSFFYFWVEDSSRTVCRFWGLARLTVEVVFLLKNQ